MTDNINKNAIEPVTFTIRERLIILTFTYFFHNYLTLNHVLTHLSYISPQRHLPTTTQVF